MPDFRKVTGEGGVETNTNFLRGEVTRLARENAALNQELVTRAQPRVAEMMDAVRLLLNLSQQGNPGAKQLLKQFFDLFDAARAETSALTIVRTNGSS